MPYESPEPDAPELHDHILRTMDDGDKYLHALYDLMPNDPYDAGHPSADG